MARRRLVLAYAALVRLVAATAGVLLLVMTMMLASDDHLQPRTPAGALTPSRVALNR